ncbi:MAG: dihydroorotase [Leptospirales bacterium]
MKPFLCLKNIDTVATDESGKTELMHGVDILIDRGSGIIEKIAAKIPDEDKIEKINLYEGKLVLPGFIDPHVHFRYPGKDIAENWNSGSLAALFAGVTTVLDMPNTSPPTVNEEGLRIKLDHIEKESFINYGLFGGLTRNNLEFLLKTDEIKAVKIYLASTTGDLLIEKMPALQNKMTDKVFTFHAEDETIIRNNRDKNGPLKNPWEHSSIRSEEAAISATKRVIELSKTFDLKFHIAHVTTDREVELLQSVNSSRITFEVAPHHMYKNTDDYKVGAYQWKCNPPLRSPATSQRLRECLHNGEIPMIATDHAPHPMSAKTVTDAEPASGVPSLEVGTHLVLSDLAKGKLTEVQAANVLSANAANLFSIQKRGKIQTGNFADLAIVDLQQTWTFNQDDVQSACGWSPFVGDTFDAKVVATFVNGVGYRSAELKKFSNLSQTGQKRTGTVYRV